VAISKINLIFNKTTLKLNQIKREQFKKIQYQIEFLSSFNKHFNKINIALIANKDLLNGQVLIMEFLFAIIVLEYIVGWE